MTAQYGVVTSLDSMLNLTAQIALLILVIYVIILFVVMRRERRTA